MDTRGVITSWNHAAEVMKGYRADEAIGQHLSLLYREEDRARGWADHNLGEAAKHGFYSEETWRRKKDGSLFWAHIALTGLRDEHDQLIGFSKVTMDLTRHKMLEQCLDEKEENRRIMTAANAGTWQWDAAGRRLQLSPALKQLLGYDPDGAAPAATSWRNLVDRRDVPAVCAKLRSLTSATPAQPLTLELRLCRQDGNCRWFFLRADWIARADGTNELSGVCVDIHDMRLLAEERERLLDELQRLRLRFRAVIDQMPSGVFIAEVPSGKLIYQNLRAKHLFGATLEDIATFHDYARIDVRDPDGRPLAAHEFPLAQAIITGRPVPARELVWHMPGAAPRYFRVGATPVQADGDDRRLAVAVANDIDDLKRVQESLRAEKERAEVTLRAISSGVITTGLDGRIDSLNTAAERLTGWSQQQACGLPLAQVLQLEREPAEPDAAPDRAPDADPVLRCMREGRQVTSDAPAVLRSRNGNRHAIEYAATPLQLPDNRTGGAVLVLNDVTESRGLLKNLSYQASHDVLTGLVNRREFGVRLQRALDRTGQPGASNSALLYLDLDQFKIVNDTCGHGAGDDLLRQLSVAYGAHVRERDTLARIGGDEFALIVEHCTVEEAKVVANKLLETTRNFRYICNNQVFRLGVSIGLMPLDGGTTTMEEALRQADHACYVAKESGRNRVFLQQRGGAEIAQRRNDMYWVKRLGDAFRNDALQLYHQPIRALGGAGNGGLHYEILLRMKDGGAAPVGPTSFLPAAERYDIMQEVDRWVLDRSLAWLESQPGHVDRLELCTINLSQRALADPGFQQYAVARIQQVRVPTHKLCFEITETGAFANLQSTLSFVLALQRLGCRFALDDFGTGMASFAYLKQLPVDYVKIDGSFI